MSTIVYIPRTIRFPPPPTVTRKLAQLGQRLRLARQRRRLTMTVVAERSGVTRATLTKVEQGNPHVSMAVYANVLFALGLACDLDTLARDDKIGRALQDAALGTLVVSSRRATGNARRHSPRAFLLRTERNTTNQEQG